MLDLAVEDVLLDAALSQAKTDVERKAWQRVVDRLRSDNHSPNALFIMSSCTRLILKAKHELHALWGAFSRSLFPRRLYA